MTKQVVWPFRKFFFLQFDTKFASKQQRWAKIDTILWLLLLPRFRKFDSLQARYAGEKANTLIFITKHTCPVVEPYRPLLDLPNLDLWNLDLWILDYLTTPRQETEQIPSKLHEKASQRSSGKTRS